MRTNWPVAGEISDAITQREIAHAVNIPRWLPGERSERRVLRPRAILRRQVTAGYGARSKSRSVRPRVDVIE